MSLNQNLSLSDPALLKAVSQELMLYWLQQLQVKRWQHRPVSVCSEQTNNNNNMTGENHSTHSVTTTEPKTSGTRTRQLVQKPFSMVLIPS